MSWVPRTYEKESLRYANMWKNVATFYIMIIILWQFLKFANILRSCTIQHATWNFPTNLYSVAVFAEKKFQNVENWKYAINTKKLTKYKESSFSLAFTSDCLVYAPKIRAFVTLTCNRFWFMLMLIKFGCTYYRLLLFGRFWSD